MNSNIQFRPATKAKAKLRLALSGVSGSGKTFSALEIANRIGKTAVIDTEHGSASKYASQFKFDVLELTEFSPQNYIAAIHAAEQAGYDVVVIDSLSHAWNAKGGVLEMVDKAAKRSQSGNKFTAWGDVTPLHNELIEAIVACSIHVIATMRSKTEYILEINEKGKQTPRKIGLAPIQRDGMEFEFDVWGEMDADNNMIVSKTRCPALSGAVISKPGADLADTLTSWLSDGVEPQHWTANGGRERIAEMLRKHKLTWEGVKGSVEPGKVIENLSDLSLLDWQFEARLREIAEGNESH